MVLVAKALGRGVHGVLDGAFSEGLGLCLGKLRDDFASGHFGDVFVLGLVGGFGVKLKLKEDA